MYKTHNFEKEVKMMFSGKRNDFLFKKLEGYDVGLKLATQGEHYVIYVASNSLRATSTSDKQQIYLR